MPDERPNATRPPRPVPSHRLELAGIRRSALLVVLLGVLIPVGVVIWAVSRVGGSAPPAHTAQANHPRTVAQHHAAVMAPATSPLLKAVDAVNVSDTGKGLMPPSSCKSMDSSMVTCTQPISAVDTVTFHTYPSMRALYAAYVARVKALAQGPFRANFGDCTERTTNGEAGWNHDFKHPHKYPLSDFTSGHITDDQAAGRVYCTFDQSMLHLVWTQDDGLVLGELSGAPHFDAYVWWRQIHHSVVLPGSPGMNSMPGMHSTSGTSSMSSTTGMHTTKTTKH